jgi:hypothetical protein
LDFELQLREKKHEKDRPDNAMIETFNAKVRLECLNQNWFELLEEVRWCLEQWRREYNQERPHSALRNQTPAQFVARWRHEQQLKSRNLTLRVGMFWGLITSRESLRIIGINLGSRSQ